MQSVSESRHQERSQSAQKDSQQNLISKKRHNSGQFEQEDDRINYYNQFCRLFLTNTILTTQLKQVVIQKAELAVKLAKLQRRADELSEGGTGQTDERKQRRVRRSASQIARHYKCHVEGCNKSYGSEGSLNQHIKIKHPYVYRGMGYAFTDNPTVKQSIQEDQQEEDQSID